MGTKRVRKYFLLLWVNFSFCNMSLANICNLPATPDTNFDFHLQSDNLGINQQSTTDYFKLALSWSPDYCQKIQVQVATLLANGNSDAANNVQQRNYLQCFSDNHFFWIVHGLWSSSCDGKSIYHCKNLRDIKKHPRFCKGDLPELPYSTIKPFLCMSPSAALLQGEWEKHGACDFGSAQQYFNKTQTLVAAITTPTTKLSTAELTTWMATHNAILNNKKLGFNGIEMYVCYDKNFAVIDCPPNE